MAGVFLSYDREDSDRARQVALALEKAGHEVWWDLHVRGGAQFSKVIEEALKAANAVVVLWSKHSIESTWVKDEAAVGRDTGRLVPVTIDGTEAPLGFRQFQTIDLSRSRGRPTGLRMLLADVAAMAKPTVGDGDRADPAALKSPPRRLNWALAAGAIAFAVLVAALLWWRPWQGRQTIPVVAVIAADSSSGSRALARDLLVQLGKLQATSPDALKLVSGTSEHPGLILQASASEQVQNLTAGLTLLGGENGTLLWSKDYNQPRDRQSDLRQQVAYSAAQVLRCAGEALGGEEPLNEELRKVYLNGCAEYGQSVGDDTSGVVNLFEKVTKDAPNFRPGWEKLLLASTAKAAEWSPVDQPGADPRDALRRVIADAARHFPDLPEILLAKAEMLPLEAYSGRIATLDRAKQLDPSNPAVLAARSAELGAVGRMDESLSDAQQALQNDPLSAALIDNMVSALAYSGALGNAQEALNNAQRLWPGSSSVTSAQFRFHLRYGDPRVALEILNKNPNYRGNKSFLEARIDPSPANIEKAVRFMRAGATFYEDYSSLAQTLAEFHREEELYAFLLDWKRPDARSGFEVFFRPQFRKFRQDPRFIQLAMRAGLLTYWQKSGKWPDFCFEPDLPYDCKKEAVRLGA